MNTKLFFFKLFHISLYGLLMADSIVFFFLRTHIFIIFFHFPFFKLLTLCCIWFYIILKLPLIWLRLHHMFSFYTDFKQMSNVLFILTLFQYIINYCIYNFSIVPFSRNHHAIVINNNFWWVYCFFPCVFNFSTPTNLLNRLYFLCGNS